MRQCFIHLVTSLNLNLKNYFFYLFYLSIVLVLSSCSITESEKLNFSISYAADLEQLETIQTISEKKFKNIEKQNIGFTNGTYWFKVL